MPNSYEKCLAVPVTQTYKLTHLYYESAIMQMRCIEKTGIATKAGALFVPACMSKGRST